MESIDNLTLLDEDEIELDGKELTEVLGRCGSFIRFMRLGVVDDGKDYKVVDLLKKCPRLSALSLEDVNLRADVVDYLCRSLEPGYQVSTEALLRLEHLVSIKAWQNLREMDAKRASPVTWSWLEALAEQGKMEYVSVVGRPIPIELMCRVIAKSRVRAPVQTPAWSHRLDWV